MTERPSEREAKFEVPDDFELPFLGRVVERSSVKLSARYWDTADHRLLCWGQTLRHRHASDGSEDGWTLKVGAPPGAPDAGSVLDRQELDEAGPPDEPPARLAALVLGIVRGAPLEPVATLETDREVLLIGTVEVSDDRVSSSIDETPGPAFRQIEIEAKGPGADRLLADLSDRLIRAGAKATTALKLETVLGGRPEPEVVVPRLRSTSRVEVLVEYALARSVIRLIGEDPKIRANSDVDPIHDARVATRRLRSDLKTLEPYLAAVEGLRTELGWLGGLLGAVRDLDVLIGRMLARIRELPDQDRAAAAPILARLEHERGRRRSELLVGLGSARYLTLLDELIEARRRPPVADPADERRVRPVLRKVTRKAWRRTARAVDRLGRSSPDSALHEIRKRAKRARYAAELGREVFGKRAMRLAERLADVQDGLGEVQDTVVAEERLRSLRLPSDSAFVAGMLVCGERAARAKARRRWPGLWKAARRKRSRRWFA
ncbi:MAG: CYTH and CHAD domain-containing protein [Actinomycetota bacterium]|nr:CYTH and CHAD domain-containing protein [Actinomycetota bacterium]